MERLEANGIRLMCARAGAGPRLLFISGTGGDLRRQPSVMDGPLPRRFEVLAYDQRGLGRSDKPPGPYAMADYADDAAALIAAAGWPSARVLGVSFGGMVALELAARHPGVVERLVVACASPGGAGGSSYPLHTLADMAPDARARFLTPIFDTRLDAAWAAANPEAHAALIAAAVDPFDGEPGRAEGARLQLEARAGHDVWDRLPGLACPTLIAAGRYDALAPPQAQTAMAGRIPGAKLRMFEGGHMFMLQDREALPVMADFLAAD